MLQKTRSPESLKVEETINLIRSFYLKSYSAQELLTRSKLEHKRYSLVAIFPKDDPNFISYMTGLATINLLIVAIQTLSIQIATERKQGWIKILRITPLPAWIYLTSNVNFELGFES
ncbi:hypothetical protein PN497_18670 [Sphaerospermopsis kisseleviana CS-549]|uniref:Uncharacterized protein n=1 Tax=Sphaerospermopsis kisseleviana CS-549 TaxID=3021783 RepID=A0ABT4ZVE6_9CYAN|nr:hypothetical protein [Sphaerospermopsis kisseleviana]MDB9443367.1 hypothetical protein [Sphaerospermopsis kisseleviana CS-549]BAZ79088.1 ABC-2 type transport system permease protein [Sphaerospermopsis kisseleviana NIES-73]